MSKLITSSLSKLEVKLTQAKYQTQALASDAVAANDKELAQAMALVISLLFDAESIVIAKMAERNKNDN